MIEDKAAFPRVVTPGFDEVADGMELRDYFAAAALQGMLASPVQPTNADISNHGSKDKAIAVVSYIYADAMLEARKPK